MGYMYDDEDEIKRKRRKLLITIGIALFLINLLVPVPWEFQISCGNANTFLFCEIANFAVTLVPLRYTASITRTPKDNPLTIRFLSKK